ncbi:MAG TPA: DUF3089 domain-containing protein, partial [Capillimicrobium sp.]
MAPRLLLLALAALLLAGAAPASARTVWLCHPSQGAGPCTSDRAATVVAAGGERAGERFPADRPRGIDCFYVYPTVSAQTTVTATKEIDAQLRAIAELQASRFTQHCRVFAPVYRQLTVGGLTAPRDEARRGVDRAYGDVAAAWRSYLRRDNDGRGVTLIGHSQGTGMLTRLIAEEIDRRPAVRRRLVSALLIGGNVLVPEGRDVGGSFDRVPACRSARQTGCVVAYNSYLGTPPSPSLFARGTQSGFEAIFGTGATGRDLETLCVDPAAPGGGGAPLRPFFRADDGGGDLLAWVTYPDRYRGRCDRAAGASFLRVIPRPGDPRPVVTESLGAVWGLHLDDVQIALGDLVALVGRQARAY